MSCGMASVPFGIRKYIHEFIDMHRYLHLDILFKMWISIGVFLENIWFRFRDIYIYIFRYPQRYPYAIFRYLHVDFLFKMWISINGYGYPYCNQDKADILDKYLHKTIDMYGYIHRYPYIYLNIMDIHIDRDIWISI